jgi:hypothetical protein
MICSERRVAQRWRKVAQRYRFKGLVFAPLRHLRHPLTGVASGGGATDPTFLQCNEKAAGLGLLAARLHRVPVRDDPDP